MKQETGICANCGADYGLHASGIEVCPKNGLEETRFDKLSGKYIPQQWQDSVFEDSGIKKLNDAAPNLLENLARIIDRIEENGLQECFPSAYERAKKAIEL